MNTLLRILRTIVLTAAALAAAAALVGIEILAPTKWLPDLLTFFMPYLALAAGCVIITVLLILRPRFGLVGLAALIAGVFVSVAPGNTSLSSEGRTLRLTTFNVLFSNFETEPLRRYAADMGSDVVLLQEAGWPWPEKTAEWTEYPYRYVREDRRLIVLSKLPLLGEPLPLINTHWDKPRNMNALRIELSVAGRPAGEGTDKLVVYAVHAPTPRVEGWWHERNSVLRSLADLIQAEAPENRVVVAGDWNTPIWSPYFRTFLNATGLTPSHQGLWPETTRYFKEYGLPDWFGSTIDHVAVNSHVKALDQIVGPDLKSDHFPVTVDLAVQ